jgi:16S rRNA C1402 N4-methylase RsmH
VINKYSISDLAKIFIEYAEFTPQKSKEIAQKIIEFRKRSPINTTFELKYILNQVGL